MTPSFAAMLGNSQLLPPVLARKTLLPVYAKYPSSVALAISLGAVCVQPQTQSATDEAIGYFRAARALQPNNTRVRLMLSMAHTARDRHDEAIAEAEAAVAAAPDALRTASALGYACLRGKQHFRAMREFQNLLSNPATPRRVRLDAHSGLGECYYELGRYAESAQAFQQGLQLEPDEPTTLSYYADALEANGQLDEAMAAFARSMQPAGETSYPAFRHGLALIQRRRHAEAIPSIDKALESPLAVEGCVSLAVDIALEMRDFDKALAYARRSRTEFMQETTTASQQRYIDRAESYLRFAKMTAAERANLRKTEAANNVTLMLNLAEFYRVTGEPDQAVAVYQDFESLAKRFNISLDWASLIASARTAALAAKKQPRFRRLALAWLERVPEGLALAHSEAKPGSPRNPARKTAMFLLHDPDFAHLREPAELAKLPPHERAGWEWVWSRLTAVANRLDTPTTEVAPPPR
jgi:tetratricopeptide (TPR) repeat protein